MQLVIDTREQRPLGFGEDIEVVRGTLKTGDYSLVGYETSIACERKSLDDLIGCLMGKNRDRFERELARGMEMDLFAVVVEAGYGDLLAGKYRSKIRPHAAAQSLIAFQVRYDVPFIFTGSRENSAYYIKSLLEKFEKARQKDCD